MEHYIFTVKRNHLPSVSGVVKVVRAEFRQLKVHGIFGSVQINFSYYVSLFQSIGFLITIRLNEACLSWQKNLGGYGERRVVKNEIEFAVAIFLTVEFMIVCSSLYDKTCLIPSYTAALRGKRCITCGSHGCSSDFLVRFLHCLP